MPRKPTKKTAKKSAKKPKTIVSPIMYYSPKLASMRRTAQSSTGTTSSSSSSSPQGIAQSPLFYDYRFSTPDKFYFPRSRAVANRVWREVYMRDAAISAATDMYADMPWSQFDLLGIDDPQIRKIFEDQFNELNLVPKLPNYTRDFLITGEFIPHVVFDSSRGIWERVISYNPDYVRVEGTGIAIGQPLLWLRPTPEIRKLINSADPRVRKRQKLIPREVINAFRMNKEVPLDELNTTYMARLNTSNNIRGTSLYTRLFRVIMYEDFIVNASLAVAQRNAAPLRIFKLGDKTTGWLPSADDEEQFAEMLSIAESDPLAAIIMHGDVSTELVGVSDRVLLISREWDFIERVKLLALGVAKSFLVGETSFACFENSTPVMMENKASKPIEEIKNGDIVLNQYGQPSKVVNNWSEGIPNKLLEIKLWGGRVLRVTHNHRFPAWVWPRDNNYELYRKIEAKDLKADDYLKMPMSLESVYNMPNNPKYTWRDNKFRYIKILSIKEIDNDKPVYNLEVEGDHTYMVLDGIATCNSAVAGLQNLMERLAALRYKFEHEWMIKKLCKPISEMHGFYKRTQSEIEHRIRIDRPEDRELIVPKIKWQKSLESTQDVSILGVWDQLRNYGIVSDRTYASGAGLDLETERKNQLEERKYRQTEKEWAEKEGLPEEVSEEEGMGGGGPTLPRAIPTPSSKESSLKKSSSDIDNSEELEAKLEELVDNNGKIDLEAVLDIIRGDGAEVINLKKRKLAKNLKDVEKQLPIAGNDLLSGSSQ